MIVFTPGMDSAPKDREILALWVDGTIQVCRWESDQYNRRGPNPYWAIPWHRGVAEQRKNPPIAWCELKATPRDMGVVQTTAMELLREILAEARDYEKRTGKVVSGEWPQKVAAFLSDKAGYTRPVSDGGLDPRDRPTTSTVMVSGAAFKRLELALEDLKQLHKSFNHSGHTIDWTAQAARLDQIKVAAQELVERGAQ